MSGVTDSSIHNFDAAAIRAQFPIFHQTLPKGHRVTFLDTAASAQKPLQVIEKERSVQQTHYANAYRGVYRFGAQIDDELEAAREAVRRLINAESSEEIAFTAGTTMSINIIANGLRNRLQPGDEILINLLEHHANFVPWQQLAKQTGAVLKLIPLKADLTLDMDQLDSVLSEKTKVVAVTGMSNVAGTITPINELAARAHSVGAVIVVDGAQSVPHVAVDVQVDDVDFLVFSGHKLYGPTGVGVLYGKRDQLEQLDPLLFGGHMISNVEVEQSTWAPIPARFEAGTLPIVQAISLGEAVAFTELIGFENMQKYEHELLFYAHRRLSEIPGMQIIGPAPDDEDGVPQKGAIVSFTLDGAHPEDLAHLLDRKGVFVRHGHHCTMPLHNYLGIPASVRASFGIYNNREDVDTLIEAIYFAREKLRLT